MAEELSKEQLQRDHLDRETDYECILTKPAPSWSVGNCPYGDGKVFCEKLDCHSVSFHERSPHRLVIGFDGIAAVKNLSLAKTPRGWKIFRDQDWSHMCVFARTKEWVRDLEIIGYIEEKARDGLWEQFDEVVLKGASIGEFVALAFASLAPHSTVLALNPEFTLDERV